MPKLAADISKLLAFCFLGMVALCPFPSPADDNVVAGPLFSRFRLPLDSGSRTEAIGPFFYQNRSESLKITAVPPLFSDASDKSADFEEFHVLYPFLTHNRFGTESQWQFFQVLSFSSGQTPLENPETSFTLFPFYFQRRSANSALNFTALFPIYGDIKNRLYRDEMFFVLFPLYGQSRKRDVVTDNYLYPFFHLRRGNALSGWQFWPLAGKEHKDVTSRTNGFGETEIVPGEKKFFALWPFYLNETTGIGTSNAQHSLAVIPFYTSLRSPHRDSTTYFWPLGLTVTDDRENKYHETGAPWPLVVKARGEGKTSTRVLPFFGRASSTNMQDNFYLWPLYKYDSVRSGSLESDRVRVLFYLYSNLGEKNTSTDAVRRRVDLWPFFTMRHDYNGNRRLQVIAPVESFLANNPSVERDWSPLWSVWRAERNPRAATASQSLLWNLYRRDASPAAKKVSLLCGLFEYESDAKTKRLRAFHLPVARWSKAGN